MPRLRTIGLSALMGALACFLCAPLGWMVVSSVKTKEEIRTRPFAPPAELQWENFPAAWRLGSKAEAPGRTLGTYAVNSLVVTAASVALILLAASLAAFAFSRLRWRGKEWCYALFLLGLIIPVQAYVLPLRHAMVALQQALDAAGVLGRDGRASALLGLILPYAAFELPVAIFILRAFFDTLPRELDESARMDGCGPLGVYWRIMLPLVAPALATVAIITALAVWNEFLIAQWFVTREEFRTLPVGLNNFFGAHTRDDHLLVAALTIISVPMLLVYVVFQRRIVAGLTAGAVKG